MTNVAQIVPALFGQIDRLWLPDPARDAEQVVLLVLDGLGWRALQDHREVMPTLAAMEGGSIRTVSPATTAAALTSITTGLEPAQHGLLGYRMMVGRDVLNVLRWTAKPSAHPPDPFDIQRHAPFLGREVPVVTRSEYRTTGFTEAHLRGARFLGWQTVATLIELCARCVEDGERFVYAYYPGVDTVAHEFGLHDRVYTRELAAVDELVSKLLEAIPARATLLVTSDHGQVHLEPESWIEIPELASRCLAMAGDGRFRYCYAKKGEARALAEIAREALGERATVWLRGELLESGLLGDGATGTIPGRIGDVIIAPRDPIAITDPNLPTETKLRSGHGSLTDDEMLVPLVAARGC